MEEVFEPNFFGGWIRVTPATVDEYEPSPAVTMLTVRDLLCRTAELARNAEAAGIDASGVHLALDKLSIFAPPCDFRFESFRVKTVAEITVFPGEVDDVAAPPGGLLFRYLAHHIGKRADFVLQVLDVQRRTVLYSAVVGWDAECTCESRQISFRVFDRKLIKIGPYRLCTIAFDGTKCEERVLIKCAACILPSDPGKLFVAQARGERDWVHIEEISKMRYQRSPEHYGYWEIGVYNSLDCEGNTPAADLYRRFIFPYHDNDKVYPSYALVDGDQKIWVVSNFSHVAVYSRNLEELINGNLYLKEGVKLVAGKNSEVIALKSGKAWRVRCVN